VFSTTVEGALEVSNARPAGESLKDASVVPHEGVSTLGTNTAGETLHPSNAAPIPGAAHIDQEPSAQVSQTSRSTENAENVDSANQDYTNSSLPKTPAAVAADQPSVEPPSAPSGASKSESVAAEEVPLPEPRAEPAAEEGATKTTEHGAQTGETTIVENPDSESPSKMVVTEGGAAQEDGTVVQRE
jgi:hypothetical protein